MCFSLMFFLNVHMFPVYAQPLNETLSLLVPPTLRHNKSQALIKDVAKVNIAITFSESHCQFRHVLMGNTYDAAIAGAAMLASMPRGFVYQYMFKLDKTMDLAIVSNKFNHFNQLSALAGKRIALPAGSSSVTVLFEKKIIEQGLQNIAFERVYFEGNDEVINALLKGQVHVGVATMTMFNSVNRIQRRKLHSFLLETPFPTGFLLLHPRVSDVKKNALVATLNHYIAHHNDLFGGFELQFEALNNSDLALLSTLKNSAVMASCP